MASSSSSSPDYAGFWARAAALVIDGMVVAVVTVPLLVVFRWPPAFLVLASVAVVAFWRYCGATPGKSALALKIVDAATGEPPKLNRLVIRFLAYFVSALPFYLGFMWVAIDRRKQGWHDKIAGTIVIVSED